MKLLRALVIGCLGVSALAMGQSSAPKVSLTFSPAKAKVGQVVDGVLTVSFAEGMHAYQNPPADPSQIPLAVRVVEAGFKTVKISYPKGVDKAVGGDSKPTRVYEETITIPIKIRTPKKPGSYNVNVIVDYQQCSDVACFPPKQITAKGALSVTKK